MEVAAISDSGGGLPLSCVTAIVFVIVFCIVFVIVFCIVFVIVFCIVAFLIAEMCFIGSSCL